MSIERDENIVFDDLGTLIASTRWISTYDEGIAEWMKNARLEGFLAKQEGRIYRLTSKGLAAALRLKQQGMDKEFCRTQTLSGRRLFLGDWSGESSGNSEKARKGNR